MAQYDNKLDVHLDTVAETTIGKNKHRISIYRYNGGAAKVAVEIIFTKSDGTTQSRLVTGRWSKELISFVADNATATLEALEKHTASTPTTAVASTVNAATNKTTVFTGIKVKAAAKK